jgi:hypothetical protein
MDNNNQTPGIPRFLQDQMFPNGIIKPRMLSATVQSSLGSVPMSDGSNFQAAKSAGILPFVSESNFVRISGENLAVGVNDIYTVPVGKKCLIGAGILTTANSMYNHSGVGNILWNSQLKVNGLYYVISNVFTITNGSLVNSPLTLSPIVLNSGETLSINVTTNSGLNVWGTGLEFNALNTSIVTGRILGLANGNNTTYTVPIGKSAIFTSTGISYINNSGVSRTYTFYQVPSGELPSIGNQVGPAVVKATGIASNAISYSSMSSGDSIVINTDAATATQIAWSTVFEI